MNADASPMEALINPPLFRIVSVRRRMSGRESLVERKKLCPTNKDECDTASDTSASQYITKRCRREGFHAAHVTREVGSTSTVGRRADWVLLTERYGTLPQRESECTTSADFYAQSSP